MTDTPAPVAQPLTYGPCGCGCHNDARYHPGEEAGKRVATLDAARSVPDGHGATLDALTDELAGLGPSLRTRVTIEETIAAIRSRWSIETRHVDLTGDAMDHS